MHGSGGPEFNHFWLDVTKTSKTSITSGFCTDVTLDVHFQGATLACGALHRGIRISDRRGALLLPAAGSATTTSFVTWSIANGEM